jgi:hypothetical protein
LFCPFFFALFCEVCFFGLFFFPSCFLLFFWMACIDGWMCLWNLL